MVSLFCWFDALLFWISECGLTQGEVNGVLRIVEVDPIAHLGE